jgi:hypothetical protein
MNSRQHTRQPVVNFNPSCGWKVCFRSPVFFPWKAACAPSLLAVCRPQRIAFALFQVTFRPLLIDQNEHECPPPSASRLQEVRWPAQAEIGMDSSGRCSTAFGPSVGLFARIHCGCRTTGAFGSSIELLPLSFVGNNSARGKAQRQSHRSKPAFVAFRGLRHFASPAAPVSKKPLVP